MKKELTEKTIVKSKSNTTKKSKKETLSIDRASFEDVKKESTVTKSKTSSNTTRKTKTNKAVNNKRDNLKISDSEVPNNADFYRSTLRFENSKKFNIENTLKEAEEQTKIYNAPDNIDVLYNKNKNNQSSFAYIYKTYLEDIFDEEPVSTDSKEDTDSYSFEEDNYNFDNNSNKALDTSIYDNELKFEFKANPKPVKVVEDKKEIEKINEIRQPKVSKPSYRKSFVDLLKSLFVNLFKTKPTKTVSRKNENVLDYKKINSILKESEAATKINETIDSKVSNNDIIKDRLINDEIELKVSIDDPRFKDYVEIESSELNNELFQGIILEQNNNAITTNDSAIEPSIVSNEIIEDKSLSTYIILDKDANLNEKEFVASKSDGHLKKNKFNLVQTLFNNFLKEKIKDDNKEINANSKYSVYHENKSLKIIDVDINLTDEILNSKEHYSKIEKSYLNNFYLSDDEIKSNKIEELINTDQVLNSSINTDNILNNSLISNDIKIDNSIEISDEVDHLKILNVNIDLHEEIVLAKDHYFEIEKNHLENLYFSKKNFNEDKIKPITPLSKPKKDSITESLIVDKDSLIDEIELESPCVEEKSLKHDIKVKARFDISDSAKEFEDNIEFNEENIEDITSPNNTIEKFIGNDAVVEDKIFNDDITIENEEIIDESITKIDENITYEEIDEEKTRQSIFESFQSYFAGFFNQKYTNSSSIEPTLEIESKVEEAVEEKPTFLKIIKEYYKTVLFGILFGVLIFDLAIKFISKEKVTYNFADINSSYTTKDYSIEVPSDWSFSDEYPGFLVNKGKKLEFKMSISAGDITEDAFSMLVNELSLTHEVRKDIVNEIEVYGFEYKNGDADDYNYYLLYYDGAAIVINLQNEKYSKGLDIISTIK